MKINPFFENIYPQIAVAWQNTDEKTFKFKLNHKIIICKIWAYILSFSIYPIYTFSLELNFLSDKWRRSEAMFETVEDSAVKRQLQTSKNKSGLYSTQFECGNDPFF